MRFQRADFGLSLTLALCAALADLATAQEPTQPQTIRDLLWVWGNPEMAKPGEQTLATFTQASSAGRARLLGVPNVLIAGQGIPNDDAQANALTCEADLRAGEWAERFVPAQLGLREADGEHFNDDRIGRCSVRSRRGSASPPANTGVDTRLRAAGQFRDNESHLCGKYVSDQLSDEVAGTNNHATTESCASRWKAIPGGLVMMWLGWLVIAMMAEVPDGATLTGDSDAHVSQDVVYLSDVFCGISKYPLEYGEDAGARRHLLSLVAQGDAGRSALDRRPELLPRASARLTVTSWWCSTASTKPSRRKSACKPATKVRRVSS